MPDGIRTVLGRLILQLAAAAYTRIGNAAAETRAKSTGSSRFFGLKGRGPLHILRAR